MYRLGAYAGWHDRHCAVAWYTALPRSTAAASLPLHGSGVGTIGSPGSSSCQRGEKVFRYWMTERSVGSGTPSHARIAVPCRPKRTMRTKSSSLGSVPAGTAPNLNDPSVKSRGGGRTPAAAGPFPSPLSPWHARQYRSYERSPSVSTDAGTVLPPSFIG